MMTNFVKQLTAFIAIQTIILGANANYYDPHKFPSRGPFFEGWYLRVSDPTRDASFGVLFGKVLPEEPAEAETLAFIGLLNTTNSRSSLAAHDSFPDVTDVSLTAAGRPVTKNPDKSSPANMTWSSPEGVVRVTDARTTVNVTIGSVHFEMETGAVMPWAEDGYGPMGIWDAWLPFPLYWFVYSVKTPIVRYKWHDTITGETFSSTSGMVHMEKNWGDSFPTAWMWVQGYSPSTGATFAITYGPIDILFQVISVDGHLAGYRNPQAGISMDFRPDNSKKLVTYDACNGVASFEFTTLTHTLSIQMQSNVDTYSGCLYGPMQNGFRPVCKESFAATAVVELRKNLFGKLVDRQEFTNAALEFGGDFRCNKQCWHWQCHSRNNVGILMMKPVWLITRWNYTYRILG